jgi:UDP-N-acetylmuramyl pentapeptide phosphotransferase/UDP-N-acetylglucosamine-1-phosphate transferase
VTFVAGVEASVGPIVVVFIAAALIALLVTPVVRRLVVRLDVVDRPEARRVNLAPLPRAGGLAVASAFLLVGATFVVRSSAPSTTSSICAPGGSSWASSSWRSSRSGWASASRSSPTRSARVSSGSTRHSRSGS